MPLNHAQITALNTAITNYSFPATYFNFTLNKAVSASNMTAVETYIHNQLTSTISDNVLHGLANVIYWGYAKIGYRDVRVKKLLTKINTTHISEFQKLQTGGVTPTLRQIKNLNIPQFSGISFISKILAFLDPTNHCVLDQQLARLANGDGAKALNKLVQGQQLRVTANNQAVYDEWRNECIEISKTYYRGTYRAIDIERGFFHLVQTDKLHIAQNIYINS